MNAQDYLAAAGARIAKAIQAEAVELKARPVTQRRER